MTFKRRALALKFQAEPRLEYIRITNLHNVGFWEKNAPNTPPKNTHTARSPQIFNNFQGEMMKLLRKKKKYKKFQYIFSQGLFCPMPKHASRPSAGSTWKSSEKGAQAFPNSLLHWRQLNALPFEINASIQRRVEERKKKNSSNQKTTKVLKGRQRLALETVPCAASHFPGSRPNIPPPAFAPALSLTLHCWLVLVSLPFLNREKVPSLSADLHGQAA